MKTSDHPRLAWTADPALREAFDRSPCLLRGACREATDAWSIAALDQWLTRGGLGWPEVRLFKDGAEVPAQRYTVGSGGSQSLTDVDALLAEYADGATIQTIGIDVFHAPVRAWCEAVVEAFAPHVERIHANAYLTPADARGFDHHWDTHDVIVLQLEGRKHWQVHGAPLPFPGPDQVCGPHRRLIDEALRSDPLIDTVLEPGDLLYLPRGQIHAARTAGACSLHLTLGLHMRTRLGRLQSRWRGVLAELARDPIAHQALSTRSGSEADMLLSRALQRSLDLLAGPGDPSPEEHAPARTPNHEPAETTP